MRRGVLALVPVIALAVSAAFEGWRPSWLSLAGMALCLGSVYAATRPVVPSPPAPPVAPG